jgi:hypothetical protein
LFSVASMCFSLAYTNVHWPLDFAL